MDERGTTLGTDASGKSGQKSEREQKTTMAAGIAMAVVALLLGLWFMVFFKNVLRGQPVATPWGDHADSVDFSSLKEAAEEFTGTYQQAVDSFQDLRDAGERAQREAAQQAAGGSSGAVIYDVNGTTQGGVDFGI